MQRRGGRNGPVPAGRKTLYAGPMRLKADEIRIIKHLVAEHLGAAAEVRLFGSRVDDGRRGGDIDLIVTVDARPDSGREARLHWALEQALDDQRVDLLLHVRGEPPLPIQRIAYRTGAVL